MQVPCDFKENRWINYRGLVNLLDLDNIICCYGDRLRTVSTDACLTCENLQWSSTSFTDYLPTASSEGCSGGCHSCGEDTCDR